MKKVVVFVVFVILLPAFLFINNCGNERCTIPTQHDYYHYRFTLDGSEFEAQEIILNFGDDAEPEKPYLFMEIDSTRMAIVGWYCRGGDERSITYFGVSTALFPQTPEVYVGVYGGSGPSIGNVDSQLSIWEDDIEYKYTSFEGTLTITTLGNVGSDVVGTFNFIYESTNPAPSFSTPLTATGGFLRVLRIPDRQE
jgi:hypothetical protein